MNTILIGEHKFQTRILFIDRAAFSHSGIQNLLADTQIFRCYFKKFIGINKVKCLFEAENTRRCQTKCFICAGRTCVSKMFCLHTFSSILDISFVWCISFKACVDDTISFCICHELTTVSDQSTCRDKEFETSISTV